MFLSLQPGDGSIILSAKPSRDVAEQRAALAWWPLILMLWVTPALATMGMAPIVLILARVNSFMEAYQMSALLVLVVLTRVAGQATGVLL